MKTTITLIILLFTISLSFAQENRDTITTASGLKYVILKKGNGEKAKPGMEVGLMATGTFTNGEVFWETKSSNSPFYFITNNKQVIKGCEEGVSLMQVGDRFLFIMPPHLAYGSRKRGNIPPNSTLIFDYELVSMEKPKRSIQDTLLYSLDKSGATETIKLYWNMKLQDASKFNFREDQLNSLGYTLIQKGRLEDALTIMKLNTEVFPNSANTFDSLGEVYMLQNKPAEATKAYKQSLDLNPNNENAKKMLKQMRKE